MTVANADQAPSPLANLTAALARTAKRTWTATTRTALVLQRQSAGFRAFVLQTSGLAGMSAGAWVGWGAGAGLAVSGVACFVLNFLLSDVPPDGHR